MNKKVLIVAEKPSQANEYAQALTSILGSFKRQNGYLESDKAYITWCYGHLISLERDTFYRGEKGVWNINNLPFILENLDEFKYSVIKDDSKGKIDDVKNKQVKIIDRLIKSSELIVNGTDADREGELIFYYIINYLNFNRNFKRLWLNSLTHNDIIKGFNNLIDGKEPLIVNLQNAGKVRAISDWLIGINATQGITSKFGNGKLLSMGRVQTAVLKIICERFLKNKNHNKESTFKIECYHDDNFTSISTDTFLSKIETENIIKKLNEKHLIEKVEDKKISTQPPLLYSLDTLTIDANSNYGYSSQDVLNIAQKLYEKKMISYPRTAINYINKESFEKIKTYFNEIFKKLFSGNADPLNENSKSVDDSKLDGSHDAIIVTDEFNEIKRLSEKERNLYELIVIRMMRSFGFPKIFIKREYSFINKGINNQENFLFQSLAIKVLEKGYSKFNISTFKNQNDNLEEKKENSFIELKDKNSILIKKLEVKEIVSNPPALFTDATLTKALINVEKFIKEEIPEDFERLKKKINLKEVQIGTGATRPAIFEILKKRGYIETRKKSLIPTELGLSLYSTIKNLKISNVAYTALMEMYLQQVAKGKLSINDFYERVKKYVRLIIEEIKNIDSQNSNAIQIAVKKEEKEIIGECPICRKEVVKSKYSYACTGNFDKSCTFKISLTILNKKISISTVKELLNKGITKNAIKGFESKGGKKFDAHLVLNSDKKIKFKFSNNEKIKEVISNKIKR